jgi:hypothetical protein
LMTCSCSPRCWSFCVCSVPYLGSHRVHDLNASKTRHRIRCWRSSERTSAGMQLHQRHVTISFTGNSRQSDLEVPQNTECAGTLVEDSVEWMSVVATLHGRVVMHALVAVLVDAGTSAALRDAVAAALGALLPVLDTAAADGPQPLPQAKLPRAYLLQLHVLRSAFHGWQMRVCRRCLRWQATEVSRGRTLCCLAHRPGSDGC